MPYFPAPSIILCAGVSVEEPGSREAVSTPTPTMFLYDATIQLATSPLRPEIVQENKIGLAFVLQKSF